MEPRLLLSADALGIDLPSIDTSLHDKHNDDPLDPANANDWSTLIAPSGSNYKSFDQKSVASDCDGYDQSSDLAPRSIENTSTSHQQIIFIDSDIDDHNALLSDITANTKAQTTQIYLLDKDRDGVVQIAEIPDNHQNIEATHII